LNGKKISQQNVKKKIIKNLTEVEF